MLIKQPISGCFLSITWKLQAPV
uniref:Uncharacterized protein n=1 Tax=Anguilla anguilla TaxID=7936 RepID=A0A0E9UU69_ANGAN